MLSCRILSIIMPFNKDMKKRLAAEISLISVIFAAGLVYFFVVTLTPLKIPCFFHELTGYMCPGCGVTRMIISMVKLDFYSAFGYNKALFVTMPIILYLVFSVERKYVITGKRYLEKWERYLAYGEIAVLVIFGIVRNF